MRRLALLMLSASACTATNPGGWPNSLGRTPPRGARTWNSVRQNINQTYVTAMARGLVAPLQLPGGGGGGGSPAAASLAAAGYTDAALDDGWEACGAGVNGSYHSPTGEPLVNTTRFPDLAGWTAEVRSLGLTASWYMNACGCAEGEKRLSAPHYAQDAAAVAAYGFSGVKTDGCGNEPNTTAWAAALNATGVPLLYENCNDGTPFRPQRLPDGTVNCPYNFFRTSIDGAPNFRSAMWNVVQTLPWLPLSSPGCFAYADMLTFGVPAPGAYEPSFVANCNGTRLSEAEARTQMAAFALLSSPLVLGFDTANAAERALWAPIATHGATLARNAAWDGEAGRLVAASPRTRTVTVAVGGACELLQQYTLPEWLVVGKRLEGGSAGHTTRFAAVLLVGDFAGAVDFAAPLDAMGFPAGATVASADGWSGADTGDVTGAWTGAAVAAPGALYREFTLSKKIH